MTTIVGDALAGVMCSDSVWISDDECGDFRKVFRVRGELIGMAGSVKPLAEWLAAYRKGEPLKGADVTVLRLSGAGLACWTVLDGWHAVPKRFAIGSGGKVARGALYVGATAQQAVRAAIEIDASTGGKVRTYRL